MHGAMKKQEIKIKPSPKVEQPSRGYLNEDEIKKALSALKLYTKKTRNSQQEVGLKKKKDLLEAGQSNPAKNCKILVEVVFKNIPTNSRTYIHNVTLPNHWRHQLEPEDYNMAIFVRHRRPENEAQKIQFSRDRELDIENTHSYYQELFRQKLDENVHCRISRIITVKELATEFNTFQKLDRLSKTYDLFLADKQLMADKMSPLPRRLGRRFWVREKKVPLMIRLEGVNMAQRFDKVLNIEPFYVLGRSTTEKIQVGLMSQTTDQLVENTKAFLEKLYDLYGDNVRFIRLKTDIGHLALPIFADLSITCPKVVMRKRRIKPTPVVDDFDMLPGDDVKVSVKSDGTVKVLRQKRKRLLKVASSPEASVRKAKRVRTT